jgi:hypothetical protein
MLSGIMLNVANNPFMLSVAMLSDVAPNLKVQNTYTHYFQNIKIPTTNHFLKLPIQVKM